MFAPTDHTLPPLSPQPPLKSTSIQPFRSLPLRRSPEIPVAAGLSIKTLDFPRLRAIIPSQITLHSTKYVSPGWISGFGLP